MRWPSLLHLSFIEYQGPIPQLLLIHLRGNDLGLLKGKAVVIQVRDDFKLILQCWLGFSLVWLAMIPRKVWWGTENVCAMDWAYCNASREIKKKIGGQFRQVLATSRD